MPVEVAAQRLRDAELHGLPGSHLRHCDLELEVARVLLVHARGVSRAVLAFAIEESKARGGGEITLLESDRDEIVRGLGARA